MAYHGSTVRSDASSENVTSFYFRARKSTSPDIKSSEHMFKKSLGMHTGNIFSISSLLKRKILIPTALEKNEKVKKFWSFVKSPKKDAFGITTLRENGILKTDTLDKANICNRQFHSAFTRELDTHILSKGTSPFTPMGDITFDPKAVFKLLDNLQIHRAPGPDG